MIRVLAVAPHLIEPMWPHVAPLLTKGLAAVPHSSLSQVRTDLANGTDHLWVVFDGDKPVAAFVSAVYVDQGSYLGIYGLGGRGMRRWAKDLEAAVCAAAASLRVSCIRFRGRAGWSRVLPDLREIGRDDMGVIYERAA